MTTNSGDDAVNDNNPFRPPEADIAPVYPRTEADLETFHPPRTVTAGRGWDWFVESWPMFTANPWLWIGLLLVIAAAVMAIGMLPVISLLGSWLVPMFMGGWVFCCHRLATDGEFLFEDLFAPFTRRFRSMAILSLIYLGLNLATTFIAMVITIGLGLLFGMSIGFGSDFAFDPGWDIGFLLLVVAIGFLVYMALFIPVLMLIWFAPTLVMLHDVAPLEAMKVSFRGCIKNIIPFTIYGLVGTALMIVGAIPLFLGWLVVYPLFFHTVYVAYRDIFIETD